MRSRRWLFHSLVCVLLIVTALIPVSMASADSPVFYSGVYEYEGPTDFQPCPGFELWDHEYAPYTGTAFYDRDGNLKSLLERYVGSDTFYNPENPGVQLVGEFTAILEYETKTGVYNGKGVTVHVVIPGYGKAFFWTGYWTVYPSDHLGGIDSTQNPKDMEAFCSYLSKK